MSPGRVRAEHSNLELMEWAILYELEAAERELAEASRQGQAEVQKQFRQMSRG